MDMEKLMANGMIAVMVGLGHDLGLFEALQTLGGKCSSSSLAKETGLNERYVREWLGAMVATEVMEITEAKEYCIMGSLESVLSCSVQGKLLCLFGRQIPAMKQCFKSIEPKGYTMSEFPDFMTFMDKYHKDKYTEEWFQKTIFPTFEFLPDNSTVLDFGCGTGQVSPVLAKKFPSVTFYGIDLCQDAIKYCNDTYHFPNLQFMVSDVDMPADWNDKFDLVMLVDVLHDLSDPAKALTEAKRILKPGGLLYTLDPPVHSDPKLNAGNKYTLHCYIFSLMNCLPSSMAAPPRAGLGAAWGYEDKVKLLEEIGFKIFKEYQTGPNPLPNVVVCTKPR
ncbi:hypothetical protein FSP39_025199 [Pinctada imbricata]|uniref:Methyltransferase domain-containing protein n=1 Tax=Pinctada imbricata TaxID=66713 RepID=A0AA88XEK2_PINIB|nr:hypothetical protein FSP39_025199 [Pinctada imbricata]